VRACVRASGQTQRVHLSWANACYSRAPNSPIGTAELQRLEPTPRRCVTNQGLHDNNSNGSRQTILKTLFMVLARAQPVHLMKVERRQATADTQELPVRL